MVTVEEIEDAQRAADKAKILADTKIIAVQHNEIQRLRDVLRGYEQWEANLVMHANWETTRDGLPALTYPLYDELMALQARRNEVLGK